MAMDLKFVWRGKSKSSHLILKEGQDWHYPLSSLTIKVLYSDQDSIILFLVFQRWTFMLTFN